MFIYSAIRHYEIMLNELRKVRIRTKWSLYHYTEEERDTDVREMGDDGECWGGGGRKRSKMRIFDVTHEHQRLAPAVCVQVRIKGQEGEVMKSFTERAFSSTLPSHGRSQNRASAFSKSSSKAGV